MPRKKRSDWTKERESFAVRTDDLLINKASAHQNELLSFVLDLLTELDLDDGRIKFNLSNIGRGQQITSKVSVIDAAFNSSVVNWIVNKIEKLVGLNRSYYSSFLKFDGAKIEEKATRLTMRKLGYDNLKGKLVENGYLGSIAGQTNTTETIAGLINQAIAGKMPLRSFRKQFKDVLINPQGLGIAERYFKVKTHDLFQSQDRQINDLYANDLKLNFAVYSGTLIKTSRPFCKARNGKVFHRSEIESWSNLEFQGKPKVYNPITDLGGYNCRHHLSWISDEIAEKAYGKDIDNYK